MDTGQWMVSMEYKNAVCATVSSDGVGVVWVHRSGDHYEWKHVMLGTGALSRDVPWTPITGAHTLEQAKAAALVLFRMRG